MICKLILFSFTVHQASLVSTLLFIIMELEKVLPQSCCLGRTTCMKILQNLKMNNDTSDSNI